VALSGSVTKEPLYRKVNTRALRVHHGFGGDYRHLRHTVGEVSSDLTRGPMAHGVRRGLDYTPLFRFLLSRVGADWDTVHSEAVARLDRREPIFWMVAVGSAPRQPVVWLGESARYSGLYVDDANRLRIVDPTLGPEKLTPTCACCTHTFNGVRLTRKYQPG